MPGNQHMGRKADLRSMLHTARFRLLDGDVESARFYLRLYRTAYKLAPASTRRRWRCGH